jgi:hypothetical protein
MSASTASTAPVSAETILAQAGSILTSAATPVTAVSNAVAAVATDLGDLQNPTLIQRVNQLKNQANEDAQKMADRLLSGDMPGVQLAFDGMPKSIGVSLSEADFQRLQAASHSLDLYSLLGIYCLARGGQLAQDVAQLEQFSLKA